MDDIERILHEDRVIIHVEVRGKIIVADNLQVSRLVRYL